MKENLLRARKELKLMLLLEKKNVLERKISKYKASSLPSKKEGTSKILPALQKSKKIEKNSFSL